ncbi:MAG: hypothetical protein JOZ69_21930 [Myxococcales bacterium]|nr:hypothetical protein [Myxococcales bacterium]
MPDEVERRCRTCARFVRVVETIDSTGEVRRAGDCLLGVWPSPLYETSTCSHWTQRGQFKGRPLDRPRGRDRSAPSVRTPLRVLRAQARSGQEGRGASRTPAGSGPPLTLPEELLDMDADEFRRVLTEVLRDELGVGEAQIAGRWEGGEMILKPGRDGLQEKRVPLESLFRKVVSIRDKLRVLEQRINSHPKLADDEKVQLQQYVTGCYGSLTTFNVLFANRDDQFVGQKGDD